METRFDPPPPNNAMIRSTDNCKPGILASDVVLAMGILNLHQTAFPLHQSINHFIVLKKDMHCTTHDLQYVGWSQQNASEFRMYPL